MEEMGMFFKQVIIMLVIATAAIIVGSCAVGLAGKGIGQAIHGPAPIVYEHHTTTVDNSRTTSTKLFSDNVVKILSDTKLASDNAVAFKSNNPVSTTSVDNSSPTYNTTTNNLTEESLPTCIFLSGFLVLGAVFVSLNGRN